MKKLLFVFMLLTTTIKAQKIDFKLDDFHLEGVELYSNNGNQIDVESIENVFADFSNILLLSEYVKVLMKYRKLVKKLTIGTYVLEVNMGDWTSEQTFYTYKDSRGTYYLLNKNKVYVNQKIPKNYKRNDSIKL